MAVLFSKGDGNMASLSFKTGVKNYDIEDENGKLLGTISIYPNDFNLGQRALEGQKKIEELLNEAAKLSENVSEEEAIKLIADTDTKIKQQLDYIFNSNVSETVFNGLNCLNVTQNGKYLIENFIDMIMPVITKELNKSIEKSAKNIKRYTSQVLPE